MTAKSDGSTTFLTLNLPLISHIVINPTVCQWNNLPFDLWHTYSATDARFTNFLSDDCSTKLHTPGSRFHVAGGLSLVDFSLTYTSCPFIHSLAPDMRDHLRPAASGLFLA